MQRTLFSIEGKKHLRQALGFHTEDRKKKNMFNLLGTQKKIRKKAMRNNIKLPAHDS